MAVLRYFDIWRFVSKTDEATFGKFVLSFLPTSGHTEESISVPIRDMDKHKLFEHIEKCVQ